MVASASIYFCTHLPLQNGAAKFAVPRPGYVVGTDAGVYFVQGTTATRLDFASGAPQSGPLGELRYPGTQYLPPTDAGISANGIFCIFYGTVPIGPRLAGGALRAQTLYVATRDGVLHALSDAR